MHAGLVDECHRQAPRCFNPVDPELDPSSCGKARAAPSTGAGRERGRDGTGRTLAFPSKKKNKLWIWLAFDRSGQRLVDWECGDAATLNRLLERLKPWSVTLYCTDDYGPYDTLLPVGRHYIGKDETVAIERVNSRLRHWFARFRPVWCRKRSRWSTPPVCRLPRQSNSGKTHLATDCLTPSLSICIYFVFSCFKIF